MTLPVDASGAVDDLAVLILDLHGPDVAGKILVVFRNLDPHLRKRRGAARVPAGDALHAMLFALRRVGDVDPAPANARHDA